MRRRVLFSGFLLASFCIFFTGFKNLADLPLREVIFDPGTPELSVAVMGDQLLEMGDFYEGGKIIGFERSAVILKKLEADDAVKCLVSGKAAVDEKLHQRAVHLFIAKQMKAIGEAQTAYWTKFGDTYAVDLGMLEKQGLIRGFKDGIKQNYFFEVGETGKTKPRVYFGNQPTFVALASPLEGSGGELYFSVNQLGEVRYGSNLFEASWGPVWEYNERLAVPAEKNIGVE